MRNDVIDRQLTNNACPVQFRDCQLATWQMMEVVLP